MYCGNETCIFCDDDGMCSLGYNKPEFCDSYKNCDDYYEERGAALMKVYILMIDVGFSFGICGVYSNKTEAYVAKNNEEVEDPNSKFWVEEWEVE